MLIVGWNSKPYKQAIELRNAVLNRPSNLEIIKSVPVEERKAIHLVVMNKGKVIGTLYIDETTEEGTAQIKQVAISPEYHGQNIGRHLMEFAESIASKQGYERIVLTARDSAWRFYEKLGYTSLHLTFAKKSLEMKFYEKTLDYSIYYPQAV